MAATVFTEFYIRCYASKTTLWSPVAWGEELLATGESLGSKYTEIDAAAVVGESYNVGNQSLSWNRTPAGIFGYGTYFGSWYKRDIDKYPVKLRHYNANGTYTDSTTYQWKRDGFKAGNSNSYWGITSQNFGYVTVPEPEGTKPNRSYYTKQLTNADRLWSYAYYSYSEYGIEAELGPASWAGSKTGYKFDCWVGQTHPFTNGRYSPGEHIGNGSGNTSNNTLLYEFKPAWTPITYKVKYNPNGGTGSMSDSDHTYDESKNLTANGFSRTGYTFQGWATSATGSKVYDNKASVKNLTSTDGGTYNLYAVWAPISYTVSYNANGGKNVPSAQSGPYGSSVTLGSKSNPPTKDSLNEQWQVTFNNPNGTAVASRYVKRVTPYTCSGWKANNTGTLLQLGSSYTISGDVTMYAQWSTGTPTVTGITIPSATRGNTYVDDRKVTFNSNGGSPVNPISFRVTTTYTFSRWTTGATGGGTSYYANNTYNSCANLVVYAQYTSKDTSAEVTLPAAPINEGNIFNGWYTASTGGTKRGMGGDKYTPPTAGETLYAQWILGTNVTFHKNDGSGATETKLIRRNTGDNRILTNPTRDEYYFDGWNTKQDGTGVNVYNWTSITQCTNVNGTGYWNNNLWVYTNTTLNLYAKWAHTASYVYWTDGKWHPIKAWVYNNGWKETVTDYTSNIGDNNCSFYAYTTNGWKEGNS